MKRNGECQSRMFNRIGIEQIAAVIRLDNGPARDTIDIPFFDPFLRLYGLTGTGLPQPNPTRISIIDPIGSKCFIGLRDSLPNLWAVESPRLYAISAWLNSCIVIAYSRAVPAVARNDEKTLMNTIGSCKRMSID